MVPPRPNHRPRRKNILPPQPSTRQHAYRLAIASATGLLVMLLLLWLAVQYAQRDWQRKNQQARAASAKPAAAATPPSPAGDTPTGWKYELPAGAADRMLQRLASDRLLPTAWQIFARALTTKTPSPLVLPALRMALAHNGENAAIRNDLGALFLQQKRFPEAVEQFQFAEQLSPGFAPARFNLALCAISERNRDPAIVYLSRYLGQRPEDIPALRLLVSLLVQNDRAEDALRLLERVLKTHPPHHPLFLEAAVLAARLGQRGNALRYLETALNGNSVQAVIRVYQSPAFREIRLSGEGDALASQLADRARKTFSQPVPAEGLQPLRAPTPDAKVR